MRGADKQTDKQTDAGDYNNPHAYAARVNNGSPDSLENVMATNHTFLLSVIPSLICTRAKSGRY